MPQVMKRQLGGCGSWFGKNAWRLSLLKYLPEKMPIYEYRCAQCAHEFELLVLRTSAVPVCPSCDSQNMEQLLSGFAVNSEGTRQTSIDKARRSYKASGQRRDEQVAAVEYEKKERAEHGGE
jgi:putative FmdB family regulatory protein